MCTWRSSLSRLCGCFYLSILMLPQRAYIKNLTHRGLLGSFTIASVSWRMLTRGLSARASAPSESTWSCSFSRGHTGWFRPPGLSRLRASGLESRALERARGLEGGARRRSLRQVVVNPAACAAFVSSKRKYLQTAVCNVLILLCLPQEPIRQTKPPESGRMRNLPRGGPQLVT